uniref:Probable purine permease n=1 Tax=Nelumbo nucifera TaxID=4432 RepID=A0A822ZUZ1_NELNU|nr:TPA_asm: hypothetical protein HUJ06_018277 [Nelumbo nucifera]
MPPSKAIKSKWPLLRVLLRCAIMAIGNIGGPLLMRLYYLHGGNRRWLSCSLQSAGFPILLIPLSLLYLHHRRRRGVSPSEFFIEPKLLVSSAVLGLLLGLDNFMYALGLSYIPVSTSALLFATQLAFTAGFARLIVKQRFTPYSINSVVLMILGSITLGIHSGGDWPAGVSDGEYLSGFFLTLGSALLVGFILPCIEFAYSKASRAVDFAAVMQFQFNMGLFATIFAAMEMLINKDFQEIPREAREYELGHGMYYFVLSASAIVWQLSLIGLLGLIFCTTSLFTGIYGAVLLPFAEIGAVIAYHEKFTGEKGIALALCLWGFTSYFYGEYRKSKVERSMTIDDQSPQP